MGRGQQPAATAVPGSTPVQTAAAQRAAAGPAPSPHAATTAPGQPPVAPAQANRPQQGQVKLTMAQLMQLTQGAQVRDTFVLHPTNTQVIEYMKCLFNVGDGLIAIILNFAGWEPRSDGGDPGSGPDPGPAANHPTGCNGHPWPWSTTNAGGHAQRAGPALPLHSHAPIISSFNLSTQYC